MIKNPNKKPAWQSVANINALKGKINSLGADDSDLSFDAIRAAVPELADFPDGHIHQLAIDAGFDVEL